MLFAFHFLLYTLVMYLLSQFTQLWVRILSKKCFNLHCRRNFPDTKLAGRVLNSLHVCLIGQFDFDYKLFYPLHLPIAVFFHLLGLEAMRDNVPKGNLKLDFTGPRPIYPFLHVTPYNHHLQPWPDPRDHLPEQLLH